MNLSIRNLFCILSITLIILLSINQIAGLGVSGPYWNENPLIMNKGEEKTISIYLQSDEREGDLNLEGEILRGDDFVKFENTDNFFLEKNSKDFKVNLIISIPKNYIDGNYPVLVRFTPISSSNEGMVSLSIGTSYSFPVIIGEGGEIIIQEKSNNQENKTHETTQNTLKEKTSNSLWIFLIILILLFVISIIFLSYKIIKNSRKE